MTGFIYPIQGSWSWGGGALSDLGFSDFAGSGIVHMCGAAAALAGVILLGPRTGKYNADGSVNPITGANMPLATLGMFILWFGWFGFNGGSELKLSNIDEANAVARVFVNTNMAAAGGLVAALISARLAFGKSDLTMALNGALAGLVSITADPLSPAPGLSVIIGAIGGVIVVASIVGSIKSRLTILLAPSLCTGLRNLGDIRCPPFQRRRHLYGTAARHPRDLWVDLCDITRRLVGDQGRDRNQDIRGGGIGRFR